jgi:hypothetical protein
MGLNNLNKIAKAAALTLGVIASQPEKNIDHAQTKPAGMREMTKKFDGEQPNIMPEGLTFSVSDSLPPAKEEAGDQEAAERA